MPVPAKTKAPIKRGWQHLKLTDEDLPRHFGPSQNVGILLGKPSGGLVDVDLDCAEAGRLADHFLPATNCVFGRASKPRSHRLYIAAPMLKTEKFDDPAGGMLVELRSTGSQTIFPPSIHPTGESIEFDSSGSPAPADSAQLRRAVAKLAAAALLVRHWPASGTRQETALALAGTLLRAGWKDGEVGDLVEAVAAAAVDSEVTKRRETVAQTAQKIKLAQPVTGLTHLGDLLGKGVAQSLSRWLELEQNSSKTIDETGHALRLEGGQMKAYRASRNSFEVVYTKPIVPLARLRGATDAWQVRAANELPTMLDSVALSSANSLKKALPPVGAWTGNDQDVQRLVPYFETHSVPQKTSVATIGIHGERVVFPNAILGPLGLEDDSPLVYTGHYKAATLRVCETWIDLAKQAGGLFFNLTEPGAIHAIVGWFLATSVAPRIRELTSRGFPLLNVHGGTGSGKTTLLSLLWRMMGSTRDPISVQGSTDFSRTASLSSTNSLPMVFDEHRTGPGLSRFYASLREAYQGEEHERGRPDLTVVRLPLTSPIAIAGESALPDPALRQRALIVRLSHEMLGTIDPPSSRRQAKVAFENLPLWDFNGGFYQHIRGKNIRLLWAEESTRAASLMRLDTDDRKRFGPIVALVGLRLFEDFLPGYDADEAAKAIAGLERDEEEPSLVKLIIVSIFTLMQRRELRSDQDVKTEKDSLFFTPATTLHKLAVHLRREGTDLPSSEDALRDALRAENRKNGGQGIVRDMRAGKWLGGKSSKAIELDLNAIESAYGIHPRQWAEAASLTFPVS